MYSPKCKDCIVEGCPSGCEIKKEYFQNFVHVTRCEDCEYFRQYILKDSWINVCCVDPSGLRYVSRKGYCEKGKPVNYDFLDK